MPGAELNQDYLDPFRLHATCSISSRIQISFALQFGCAETGGEDIEKEGMREGKEDGLYELGPVRLNWVM
jgi:hypothetical protein